VTIAGEAWRFRTLVEREAHVRFAKMAESLRRHGFDPDLADRTARASDDEKRHAALCLELATDLGAAVPEGGWEAPSLAPASFDARDALLYEAAAQCCVAETESMATLSVLMDAMNPSRFRDAVVTIARDEVEHARIGWAVLGKEREKRSLSFLAPHLAAMIETGGAPLFADPPNEEDESLIAFGVLRHLDKRRVFVEALAEVIVPGFERLGIATSAIERWLAERGAAGAG
jgi:hypothetical protein